MKNMLSQKMIILSIITKLQDLYEIATIISTNIKVKHSGWHESYATSLEVRLIKCVEEIKKERSKIEKP
jgi:hypothetical protein